jgi:hypothetical protein
MFFNITDISEDLIKQLEDIIGFVVANNAELETYNNTVMIGTEARRAECPAPAATPPAPAVASTAATAAVGAPGGDGPATDRSNERDSEQAATEVSIMESLARARSEALNAKRKECLRFQQLKKKYSKPLQKISITSNLSYDPGSG